MIWGHVEDGLGKLPPVILIYLTAVAGLAGGSGITRARAATTITAHLPARAATGGGEGVVQR